MNEPNTFERQKNNKIKILLICLLVLFVASISIGYSVFYSELVISPQVAVTPYKNTFKVYFSKLSNTLDESDIIPTVSSSDVEGSAAIISNGSISSLSRMNVKFTAPGQSATYSLYAKNIGEYRAFLNNIIFDDVPGVDSFKKCTSISGYDQDKVDAMCESINVSLVLNDNMTYTDSANVSNHILELEEFDKLDIVITFNSTDVLTTEDFRVEFGDISLVYSTVGDFDANTDESQILNDNANTLYNLMLKNEYNGASVKTARKNIALKATPSFNSISTSDDGLFESSDDDGYIYYYRGDINDNHVIFGGFCWRIVRTTGTGGVKLVYDGKPSGGVCNNTGTATYISSNAFNSNYNSLAYVGYMYGDARITKSDDITKKTTSVIFSNSVTYNPDTDMYELDMSNSFEMVPSNWSSSNAALNYTNVVKRHYTCLDNRTSCREVYYVNAIYSSDKKVYYQTLSNGEDIDDLIKMMLDNSDNRTSSNAKTTIDNWYKKNLINYQSYLEDTIFCNDRTIYSYGGWNKDNTNYDGWLYFGARGRNYNNYSPSLICPRINDKFTVNYGRGNGNLTYPVGLLTADEMAMAGAKYNTSNSSFYLYNRQYNWSGSPYDFYSWNAVEFTLFSSGHLSSYAVNNSYGLRPSVSLKPGTLVSSGNGTSESPYIIG